MATASTLDYCDRTDVGRRRSNNQDSKSVLEPWSREVYKRRGWLFVVADGMGAHAAGETASAIAAEQVPLIYEKRAGRSPVLALRQAIEQANDEIHAKGESALDLKGMGTTCTALVIVPRGALVGHVGDSRAYRVRGARIEQLSQDHSVVWEMQASQGAAAEIAYPKNIITRSLGPHAQVKVDVEGPFPVEAGDVFVLCSDGLSGQVEDGEIGLFAGLLPPREAAEALVGLALVRGAPDNVTVIVARTGAKEASKTRADDPPWPVTDEPAAAAARTISWRLLAASSASLLASLILNPWSDLLKKEGLFGSLLAGISTDLPEAVAWTLFAGLFLVFVVTLACAVHGFLVPPRSTANPLPVGAKLGNGPYRSHDCGPTAALLEGVVASVEAAAEGLEGALRDRVAEQTRRARALDGAGDRRGALAAAAAAIGAYAAAVEAARAVAGGPGGRGPA